MYTHYLCSAVLVEDQTNKQAASAMQQVACDDKVGTRDLMWAIAVFTAGMADYKTRNTTRIKRLLTTSSRPNCPQALADSGHLYRARSRRNYCLSTIGD